MKICTLCLALLLIALVSCAKKNPAQARAEQAATESARTWLKLIDDGSYAESWDTSAAPFKTHITSRQWEQMVKPGRDPMGKLQKREVMSADYMTVIPNAPKGEYVIIQFKTDFENKRGAVETVTPMLEDGSWKVSGYYIK